MHHIPDVDLVHQNSTNRAVIPRIRIGQNNIRGKGSKLFMQVRLWAENLLFSQFLCNDAAAFARKSHLEDFLDDPCVLIRNELVAVIRVTVIAIRWIRTRVFPTQCLCLEC